MALPPGPLTGIRVVDLTIWIQGPLATTLLADLGADVIKIEKAGTGDFSRNMAQSYGVKLQKGPDDPNLLWATCNRNKRTLALDLGKPAARTVLQRLVATADVFLTNLMVEPLVQFGADEATLRAINPRLVYARAAGFGEAGPWANDPCMDTVGMGYGGILWTMSPDGKEPYYPPGALSDTLSATMLAFGVLAALRERDRTGETQYVSTSQLQSLLWLQTLNTAAVANLGENFKVSDRRNPPNPIFNLYPCGDGEWVALGSSMPHHWPAFCKAVGLEELLDNPRYGSVELRQAHSTELVSIIEERLRTAPRDHWMPRLRAAELWVAPILRLEHLVDDPQVSANSLVMTLEDGWRMARMPFTLRGHEPGVRPAPAHGQDSDAVLAETGYSAAEISDLRVAGAVW